MSGVADTIELSLIKDMSFSTDITYRGAGAGAFPVVRSAVSTGL